MAFQLHCFGLVRPLRFILKKLGYVKLSELPAPDQVLPPYSFMFRSDQGPPPPPACSCAQGSTELPLPRRIRMGSAHEPSRVGPFPYPSSMGPPPIPPRALAPRGLDYSDGDTQIMEAPSVQAMPSFMGLKREQ